MAKENAVKSKIPIPVDPLPPLSDSTLKRNRVVKNLQPRLPLETLYQEPVNSERATLNYRKVLRRSNSAFTNIDTQHVTIRQKTEHLDWNYDVFKDKQHDKDKNIDKNVVQNHTEDSRVRESGKVSTPTFTSLLEPAKIRNVKRSLKRPHSRELMGIPSTVTDDNGTEKHRRRLVFPDQYDRHTAAIDPLFDCYAKSYNQDYGPDLFNYLMMREKISLTPRITSSGRLLIMNWLVKVNGREGNPAAVQTAAWYFDTVLSVGEVQVDKLQVVAAACYWIALKIHGQYKSAKDLVKIGNNAYSHQLLIGAEKAVLRKLKFPIQPVVGQDFISYLAWVCDASDFVKIERAATLFYMAGLVVQKCLIGNYPSVLAAAAVSNALKSLQKKELLANLEKNHVYSVTVKKNCNFNGICLLQTKSLYMMSSPVCKYRALLENAQDCTLTEKIITTVKNKKTLVCIKNIKEI